MKKYVIAIDDGEHVNYTKAFDTRAEAEKMAEILRNMCHMNWGIYKGRETFESITVGEIDEPDREGRRVNMTEYQAVQNTINLDIIEDLITSVLKQGVLIPELEEARIMVHNLPGYKGNE